MITLCAVHDLDHDNLFSLLLPTWNTAAVAIFVQSLNRVIITVFKWRKNLTTWSLSVIHAETRHESKTGTMSQMCRAKYESIFFLFLNKEGFTK